MNADQILSQIIQICLPPQLKIFSLWECIICDTDQWHFFVRRTQ